MGLRSILISGLGLALSLGSPARADVQTDFQVRSATKCTRIDHPPSAAEAAAILRCTGDEDNPSHGYVTRTENVQVEVGPARPYTYGDPGSREINPNAPVYPIRGVKTEYRCAPVTSFMQNAGRNCSSYTSKGGTGICYQTTFGDWTCVLPNLNYDVSDNIPGPQ